MNKKFRAQRTGSGREGKQRSRMNAFKHNVTGNNMIMQAHELETYTNLTNKMLADFKPRTELERQIAQKIIDINSRLNRLASIENNMLNFDMMIRETDGCPCDRTEVMFAQTKAWKDGAHSFDVLGRYEARLARQFREYTKELERLQAVSVQTTEIKVLSHDLASFGNTPHAPPPVPPPSRLRIPVTPAQTEASLSSGTLAPIGEIPGSPVPRCASYIL